MAYPTGFKFNNTVTNNNVAIEDAMASALTPPVESSLLAAFNALVASSGFGIEVLSADRTYYVSTTGNDLNNGLTPLTAFATIQQAIDVISGIVIGPYNITIQLAAGTYTDNPGVVTGPWLGSGLVTIQGDNTTPGNVILQIDDNFPTPGNAYCVETLFGGNIAVSGIRFQTTALATVTQVRCLYAIEGGKIFVTGPIEFGVVNGSVVGTCMAAELAGYVGGYGFNTPGNVTFNGNIAGIVFYAPNSGLLRYPGATITIGASITVGVFTQAQNGGLAQMPGLTFVNKASVTAGQRYNVTNAGIIITGGGGATYFPGTTAGAGTNTATAPYGIYS